MKNFFAFLKDNNVVGIGVAFVLGTAVVKLVETFVVGIVDPTIALLFDTSNLTQQTTRVGEGTSMVVFSWGAVIALLINLLIVSLAMYGLLRVLGLVKPPKKATTTAKRPTARKTTTRKK